MITGNKLKEMLRDARHTVENEHVRISNSILEINRSLEKLNTRQTEMWKTFASVQAEEGTIRSDKLNKLKAERAESVEKAHRTIEIATKEIVDTAVTMDKLSKRKKDARDAINAKRNEIEETASKDDTVIISRSKLLAIDEDIKAAKKRLSDAENDIKKKRPGYDDELFNYLEMTKYGTPEYRAIPLISTLDRLLASAVGYDKAKQDFDLLTGLPNWIDTKIKDLQAAREHEAERLKEAMKKYEDGIEQLLKGQQDIDHELSIAVASHNAAVINKKNSMAYLKDVAHGTDNIQKKIVNECISLVKKEKIGALQRLTQHTKSKKDEDALNELARIDTEFDRIKAERSVLQNKLSSISERLENIETVERKLKHEDWFDSDHKFKDGSYDITGLMTGAIVADTFWRAAQNGHVDPPRDYSNYSNSWGQSSGGFSSSGSRTSSNDDDDNKGGFGGSNGWSTGGSIGGGNDSFSSGDGF